MEYTREVLYYTNNFIHNDFASTKNLHENNALVCEEQNERVKSSKNFI